MPFLDANGLSHLAELIKSNYAGKNSDGAVVSVGADYAEYADWNDGNTSNENRKGYFVTVVDGTNKIAKANSDSAIVGVTTDSAGFIGNYVKGAETNKVKGLVGIVGQISVIDNGTCKVGERCMPGADGTAVPSSNNCGYKVIERVNSNHVKIMVAPTIDMIQRIKTDVSELQNNVDSLANKSLSNTVWQFSEKDYGDKSYWSTFGGSWAGWSFSTVKKGGDHSNYFEFGAYPSIVKFKKAGWYRIKIIATNGSGNGQDGVGIFKGSTSTTSASGYTTEHCSAFSAGDTGEARTVNLESVEKFNINETIAIKVLMYDHPMYIGMTYSRVIIEYLGD